MVAFHLMPSLMRVPAEEVAEKFRFKVFLSSAAYRL